MALTLHQLKIFAAVVEQRGLTAAAKKLHMTQPAVSIQVKQLEDYYGLPLLEVVGKKIHCTEMGQLLYQVAKETDQRLLDLKREFSELQDCMKGKLSVAVVSTAKYFIPCLLGQFHRQYPNVQISLKVTNRGEVLERLQNNSDDIVILSQIPKKMPIVAHKVLEDELVIPVPPDHPFVHKKQISLSALKDEPCIYREAGSGTRMVMEQVFREKRLQPKVVMELGSGTAIKQAVIAGFGFSLLSKMSLEHELQLKKLVILDVQGFPLRHNWYAVHLKGKKLSPITANFLRLLLNQAK